MQFHKGKGASNKELQHYHGALMQQLSISDQRAHLHKLAISHQHLVWELNWLSFLIHNYIVCCFALKPFLDLISCIEKNSSPPRYHGHEDPEHQAHLGGHPGHWSQLEDGNLR